MNSKCFEIETVFLQCKYTCGLRFDWFFSASPGVSSTSCIKVTMLALHAALLPLFWRPSNWWLLWVMLFSMRVSVVFPSKSTSSCSLLLGTWLQRSWNWSVPEASTCVYKKKWFSTSKVLFLNYQKSFVCFQFKKFNMYNSANKKLNWLYTVSK